jgi:hypothetical protein
LVLIWAGSIAIILPQKDLYKFVWYVSALPFFFWIIEAYWKKIQRRSGYRRKQISEFLNDNRILDSFKNNSIVDFKIYDPTSKYHRDSDDFNKFISLKKTMRFPEVAIFYFSLFIVSIILAII